MIASGRRHRLLRRRALPPQHGLRETLRFHGLGEQQPLPGVEIHLANRPAVRRPLEVFRERPRVEFFGDLDHHFASRPFGGVIGAAVDELAINLKLGDRKIGDIDP